jgi:plasmid stabilization system protein ParE
MSLPLILAAAAEADVTFAVDYYNAEAPGLGVSFLAHVEQAFDRLSQQPSMYPVLFGNVRRALLHRFPYAVLYRVRAEAIEIIGILPCRVDPARFGARAATPGTFQ